MYGSIVSATDPVAVVALLKELGASKRLATMIEGESLLNDGTAMVVFLVLIDMVEGNPLTAGEIIGMFVRLSAGGIVLGLLGGVLLAVILSRIHNDAVREMNATIFVSYLVFYLAESTKLHVSGILAIVALGLYMTTSGKTKISSESMHTVHGIWGYIGFVAETVIFIVSGVIMGERATVPNTITYVDYLKLLGVYVGLHFIRFFTILCCWPLLRRIGYGMSFAQVVLCSYAGLRGAVGLSLALMVSLSPKIHRNIQDVVLLHVAGIALLTLLINASTTGALVRYLGLAKSSSLKQNILISVTHNIHKNIDDTIKEL
jgi:NhaP-type Na+/H+ or K+/H+ antiporter